jgi:hypothetical protein
MIIGGTPSSAQKGGPTLKRGIVTRGDSIPRRDFMKNLPRSARVGASPEARAAWEKLTPQEQAAVFERIRTQVSPLVAERVAQNRAAASQSAGANGGASWQQRIAKQGGQSSAQQQQSAQTGSAATGEMSATAAQDSLYFSDQNGAITSISATEQAASLMGETLTASTAMAGAMNAGSKTASAEQSMMPQPDMCYECDPDPCVQNPSLCEPDPTPTPTPYPTPEPTPYPTPTPTPYPTPTPTPTGGDADFDGLPDAFENQVSDAFTPVYHISYGEHPGTGFAIFNDSTPQTVQQSFPAVPPISHFRVQPLGFATDAYGNQLSVLRIDYLTLWNRDDGLDIDGYCRFNLRVAFEDILGYSAAYVLDGLIAHPLDNERSAALVAAPVTSYNTFNTDPWAYKAYDYFTTAHEGEPFTDHSNFFSPSQPIPAGLHLNLWLSQSKHGTYPFNADQYPIIQPEWIIAYFSTIDFLYAMYWIDDYTYLYYSYVGYTAFYSCFVEQFGEQGGTFSGTRINVGEPNAPINGSHFIQSGELHDKLTRPLWQ